MEVSQKTKDSGELAGSCFPLLPFLPVLTVVINPILKMFQQKKKNKKLKIELPYNPAIPLHGIQPKKTKTLI